MTQPKGAWNDYRRVTKTRKLHRCAMTGKTIPIGSSCWNYSGEFEGDFQSWYCTDEAKAFADTYDNGEGSWTCEEIGEEMRERGFDCMTQHKGAYAHGSINQLFGNTQPNDQVTETRQINVTVSELPGVVIQELEEYLGSAFDERDLDSDHLHTFQALVIGYHAAWDEIERLLEENKRLTAEKETCLETIKAHLVERAQMWEEREQAKSSRDKWEQGYNRKALRCLEVEVELEQVKAERDAYKINMEDADRQTDYWTKRFEQELENVESLRTELTDKDKVISDIEQLVGGIELNEPVSSIINKITKVLPIIRRQ